jgi:diguanylate cyclase (GGDEF)-like protein/PAS domain S-box-containing protein
MEDRLSDQEIPLAQLQSAALATAANAVIITDRNATIVWANLAFTQLTGYSAEEAIGHSTRLLKSSVNSPSLYKDLWDTILSGNRWQGELVNRRKDGTLYVEEMTITPIREGEEITHFVAIKQDITERKGSERELLFKTVLLEAQAETALDGILAVDEANRIVLSNQQFAAMWKIPPELIRAGDDTKLLQHVTNQLEEPDKFLDKVRYLYSHREEKSRDEVKLKGGRFVDRYSSPLMDSAGAYRGRIWYFRDITANRQAEEKLRSSEEQFRQLAENIREVFFVLNPEPFEVKYISPAYDEIWGRPRKEVYDWPPAWIELVHSEDRERVGVLYEHCMQGFQLEFEYRITRPDASIRWISARSFPVRDETGKLVRVVGIAEDITIRKQEEKILEETHARLNTTLHKAEQQARDSARLTELMDILQSCQTVEEAYSIASRVLPNTLSSPSGALCITTPSRNVLEAVSIWGDQVATEKAFTPNDCWALRRGKMNQVRDSTSPLRCKHVKEPTDGYLCVPLAAHGETLGTLYLECPPASPASSLADSMSILEHQASAVGERLSLALANLRLRQALQSQSIRDPLTGLFNRLFMEESLEREMGRAVRGKLTLALIMMDIDYFKRFNDTFGHQAGDTLLRALGNFLNERTRSQDVTCRYGGEEFVVILAGATLEQAQERAELLRRELKLLQVQHAGQVLGNVMLSIGIAAYPENGSDVESLVKAADDALYRAKKEGRDRVVIAGLLSRELERHSWVTDLSRGADGRMATVANSAGEKPCPMKKEQDLVDSERPSHRRC